MSIKPLNSMPVVKHEDVQPMYNEHEILDKIAQAVNGMREMKGNSQQRLDLELMYSLAKALNRNVKKRP